MDSATYSVLLLETVASSENTSPALDSPGSSTSSSDPPCTQPSGSLAHGQDNRQRCGHDKRVAADSRRHELKDSVGGTCSASLNRRMRTRTYGGVGRASGDRRPYPISALIALAESLVAASRRGRPRGSKLVPHRPSISSGTSTRSPLVCLRVGIPAPSHQHTEMLRSANTERLIDQRRQRHSAASQ